MIPINVHRGSKKLVLLISFVFIWILLWSRLAPLSSTSRSPTGRDLDLEKVLLIEDAFNDVELDPLPSDIDTSSNQSVIDVIVFAKYAYSKMKVPRNLHDTVQHILEHTSAPLHVHVLADMGSYTRIRRVFNKLQMSNTKTSCNYTMYDVVQIENKQKMITKLMRELFFSKVVERYNDDIFFLTPSFHLVFPKLQRAIFLDLDLRFQADIAELWTKFAEFSGENILGIGHDLQPHYRFEFAEYRRKHKGTDVGNARPGKQGLNTGVMLMDFDRMRNSMLYNSFLNRYNLKPLSEKYNFHGYLGHQDFFTLLANEYPELFYLLHCSWNRQLDVSWKAHYTPEVFNEYHRCDGVIKVYHANGGSKMPPEGTEKLV